MGKCTHHPQTATRENEGVCSSCLQKKLNSVWRGESSGHSDATTTTTTTGAAPIPKHLKSSLHSKEAIAVLGSIASITKRRHSSKQASTITTKGRDITEAGMDFVLDSRYSDGVTSFRKPVVYPSSASFHHARANFTGLETSSRVNIELPSVKDFTKRRSKVASLVSRKAVGKSSAAVADAKFGTTVNSLRSVECRSPPLVDRIAKETALRVIKEVGDDDISEGDGGLLEKFQEQDPRMTCFSPGRWQSKLRSKWGLKGLEAPIPASNKIFPSKSVENVQKLLQAHFSPVREESRFVSAGDVDQQRRALQQPTDLNPSLQLKPPSRESESPDVVIEGMPDRILKPEDMNQRLRTSYNTVLKWLQDLPVPETPLQDICEGEDPYVSSVAMGMQRHNPLTKVGHLQEIAEEYENLDESSVEDFPSVNHLQDVSSFGKFLIRAAQRKPKQGLSRVVSAR